MATEEDRPHFLLRRAGLGFAYLCFAVAVAAIGGALYLLPLDRKVKLFLAAAGLLLVAMFAFMAVAAHLVARTPDRNRHRD